MPVVPSASPDIVRGSSAAEGAVQHLAGTGRDSKASAFDYGSTLDKQLEIIAALSQKEVQSPEYLREKALELTVAAWADVIQERHLIGICAYPLCDKPPIRSYNPRSRRPRSSALDPFCSPECFARATHYEHSCIGTEKPTLQEDAAASTMSPLSHALEAMQRATANLNIQEHPRNSGQPVPETDHMLSVGEPAATRGRHNAHGSDLHVNEADSDSGGSDIWEEDDPALRAAVLEAMALRDSLRARGEDV